MLLEHIFKKNIFSKTKTFSKKKSIVLYFCKLP